MTRTTSPAQRLALLLTALTAQFGVACAVMASEVPGGAPQGFVFDLNEENDSFAVPATDKHYTQGIHLSLLWPDGNVPAPLAPLASLPDFGVGDATRKLGIAVGQNIYTPAQNSRPLIADDRPYAGWLYLGAIRQERGSSLGGVPTLDHLELDLGVVGPAALASDAQEWWHQATGSTHWLGWSHQLKNEPAFLLLDDRRWLAWERDAANAFKLQLIPKAALKLGNIETAASVGAIMRFGHNIPDDFSRTSRRRTGWYVFGEADGRAVLYNEFLDGDLFRSSPHVAKETLVGEWRGGAALVVESIEIRYTYTRLTPEFKLQSKWDAYGSIDLIYRY